MMLKINHTQTINYSLKIKIVLILILSLTSCNFTSDALDPFPERTFPTSKKNLETAINKLYLLNPGLKVPEKWMPEDTSIKNSYFFLESRTFYFKTEPEEMYYVTFIGDSTMLADPTKVTLAIRLINRGAPKWFKYVELDSIERKRIENRFDKEIISKLETYTNTKVVKEDK